MRGHKASIRYAKSLIELALMQNVLEEVFKDITLIRSTLNENRALRVALKSPVIKQDKKTAILSQIFAKKLNALTEAFIKIVILKKRESALTDICNDYITLYKQHKNIVTAEIKTATAISENTKKEIKRIVHSIETGNLEITELIDKDIIGGFVIKVGDKQIDESISTKLNELKREFSHNPYIVKL